MASIRFEAWKCSKLNPNGKCGFSIDKAGKGKDNPFRKPHYLLINLALGGSWGGFIDQAMLPRKYLIDYVKVYESKTGQAEDSGDRK